MKSKFRLFTPSIRRRITFAFLIVTVLVLVMAAVNFLQLSQVQPYSDAIIRDSQELVAYQELAQSLASLDSNLERYLTIRGVEYKEAVENSFQDMADALTFLEEGDDPTEEAPLILEELKNTIAQLQIDVQKVLELEPGASSREINQTIVVVYDEIEKAKQLQEELTNLTLNELESAAQTQSQIASNVLTQFVILGVIVLVIAAFTAWTTDRRLRTISTLTSTATEIAAGEFNRVAPVESDDEIGTLAEAFNAMTSQLREFIGTLEQRVTERTKALATSAEVTRHLAAILDPRQLVGDVVNEVRNAFEYYYAQIYLLDEAGENLVIAGGTGDAGATMMARGHSLPKGRGLVGRAADANASILVPDVSREEGWLPNELLPETKAEAAIPISIGDQVLGVLDVQHNLVDGLTYEDVILLESLAGQVAISLRNARSYEQTRSQAEIQALVNVIGQKIQRTTSVEDTLQTAIRELGTAIGATRVRASLQPASSAKKTEPVTPAEPVLVAEAERKNGSGFSDPEPPLAE